MAKEDFDLFWTTHLVTASHDSRLQEVTILYYHTAKEETSNFPWTRREGTPRLHATAAVARDLLTQVRVATRRNVFTATLIQNHSPCSHCAEEMIKTVALAKEKRIKLDISIAFVALNRIRRPSWVWRGKEDYFHGVPINESNDNVIALKQLQESGVKLATFDHSMWNFLYTFLGNGLLLENRGKFLGGKYAHTELRHEEDRMMEADLRQILRGVMIISPSTGVSSSALDVQWTRPSLAGQKVSEYNIVCRKVIVKNKDDDGRLWRMYQTVDKIGVKVTVSGELNACMLADLELDCFYDITVEAVVKGMSVTVGRKLFRTGNKAPIASLQTPTLTRKSSAPTRPRTSSVTSYNSTPCAESPARFRRSSSTQAANGGPLRATGCETGINRTTFLRRSSSSGAAVTQTTPEEGLDSRPRSGPASVTVSRSSSVRSTPDKTSSNNHDGKKRESVDTTNKATTSLAGRSSGNGGRKISASSITSTAL